MISILVPVLNEAPRLPALLRAIRAEPVAAEVIVADGGSTDGSAALAAALGAAVVRAPRGRGAQLAAALPLATGGIVLVLHADTTLPPGALVAAQRLLAARPDLAGGNFRLLFDGDDPTSRWVERFYARIRRFGLFYGDSGIFARRTALLAAGGIRPLALMEDWDMVRRLRAQGRMGCVADPPLVSSSRRFAGRNRWVVLAGWVRIHLLYWAGVSPDRLAALYDSARAGRGAAPGPARRRGHAPAPPAPPADTREGAAAAPARTRHPRRHA